jgi:integrase
VRDIAGHPQTCYQHYPNITRQRTMKFTTKSVEAIAPSAVRQEIPDSHMPGLYLVVQPSGARSWAVRYRHHNKSRKMTIGSYPVFNLAQAREAAGKALRTLAEGRDPGRERQEARADTVEAIAAQFIERYSKRHNRPRTVATNETLLRQHVLPHWRGRTIRDIRRRDVVDLVDGIARKYPVAANRVLFCVSKMFNWALSCDIIEASPAAGVPAPSPEHARERVLGDDEIHRVWHGAVALGFPYGPIAQLLLLTGQRRDEIVMMKWAEVDMDLRLWTLPAERVKNARTHTVPLSDAAMAVLNAVPHVGDYVFASPDGKRPGHGRGKERLDRLAGNITPWRFHDLRRTVASGLARLGVSLPVIEKILNHTSGSFAGVVGVYQRHDFADEKRKALEAWAAHVGNLASQQEA